MLAANNVVVFKLSIETCVQFHQCGRI